MKQSSQKTKLLNHLLFVLNHKTHKENTFFFVACSILLLSLLPHKLPAQELKVDTVFTNPQVVTIFSIPKNDIFDFGLAHHPTELIRTSEFAEQEEAWVAINGGFFDMEKGGSVTYLEEGDSVLHNSKNLRNKVINDGAIIVDLQGQLRIEVAKSPQYYQNSTAERAVLFSGPILLQNGNKTHLKPSSLVSQRHPRTCICETAKEILLLTIDGRQQQAVGMDLVELQAYLLTQNCLMAINLDGGGSTTMWVKDKGVVNSPSDLFGERPVANAILFYHTRQIKD